MKLVSACLVGINCRYDGRNKRNKKLVAMLKKGELLPVCPEMLAGFAIPREQTEQRGSCVYTKSGKDVTSGFAKGAEEVLKIAKKFDIKEAILKANSPSCGCGRVYDGTFSGRLIDGDGVTASLLKRNGIKAMTEDDL